jgi:hypothetical protein
MNIDYKNWSNRMFEITENEIKRDDVKVIESFFEE